MPYRLRTKTAQSTLEYAVLIVIIIGALIAMRTYLNRGIQGKLKSSTDDISSGQFDPSATTYSKETNSSSTTREIVQDGQTNSALIGQELTSVREDSATDIE
ncbi:MAG: hypothetical protein PHY73_00610 [Candidatus Omnitrophica bacterium]|nr:hypothetical protein [Candidatus Omnitrophota bacterium]